MQSQTQLNNISTLYYYNTISTLVCYKGGSCHLTVVVTLTPSTDEKIINQEAIYLSIS